MNVSILIFQVGGQLAKGENAKKLGSFESIVMKKKKLKEENQKCRLIMIFFGIELNEKSH